MYVMRWAPNPVDYPELDEMDSFFGSDRISLRDGDRAIYTDKDGTVKAWGGSWDSPQMLLSKSEVDAVNMELRPHGYTVADFGFWESQPCNI